MEGRMGPPFLVGAQWEFTATAIISGEILH